ncbi:hypothetical protein DFH09DRAFT_1116097 [Mycena vulgaris]|nr:hypothetical protein DFH09DRAFT_1116097 [Mycena vulgaris]
MEDGNARSGSKMPGEDVRRIFKKVMEVIDSGCRTNRGVNGQRQDCSRTPGEAILDEHGVQHPWDKAGRHFCDRPEKWKINNLSFKTLANYLCGVRGKQHPKRGIWESVAAQEAEVTTVAEKVMGEAEMGVSERCCMGWQWTEGKI